MNVQPISGRVSARAVDEKHVVAVFRDRDVAGDGVRAAGHCTDAEILVCISTGASA